MDEAASESTRSAEPPAATSSPPARRIRPSATAWIALGITAIVIVATAIVLLAGNRGQTTYPADSPEGALQGYLTSWYGRDYDSAYGYFSSQVKATMTLTDFRQEAQFSYGSENQTVTLDRSSGSGDSRTLYLVVEESYGMEYGGGYTHDEQVRMVREADGWKIDDPLIGLNPYFGFPY